MAKKQKSIRRIRFDDYFATLEERAKRSRAYTAYQLIGLEIAEILKDRARKALYIKLAKQYNPERLLRLAKSVAERPHVRKRGAYFMKLLAEYVRK